MDSDSDIPIKRIKIMNPYVQLSKAFVINSSPSIVKLFNNESTSDVKVILNDDLSEEVSPPKASSTLFLHRLVLASGSPMFGAWLNNYSDQSKDAVLRIPENYPWMSDFFRYFYTGHITMTSENLVEIYTVADKYLVESLKAHCEEYIRESLKIKVEKMTCPHVTSVLSKPTDNGITEQYLLSQTSLRNRTTNSDSALGTNIFFRLNQSPSRNSSLKNFNNPNLNSTNIFNTSNTTNIFAKKNFESVDLISECTNFSSKMDLFCNKCNPGPVTVTRILAFSTVSNLAQMTCNSELALLAKYNLMIRLNEELRLEDYSQFVQLPYDLLHDLLEDDNFYCSEYHLFCGLLHWIQVNKIHPINKSDNISAQSDTLLGLIRFPVMSSDDLYEVENSAKSSGYFSKVALQEMLNKAMRYMVYRDVHKAKVDEAWLEIIYKARVPVEILKLGMQCLS